MLLISLDHHLKTLTKIRQIPSFLIFLRFLRIVSSYLGQVILFGDRFQFYFFYDIIKELLRKPLKLFGNFLLHDVTASSLSSEHAKYGIQWASLSRFKLYNVLRLSVLNVHVLNLGHSACTVR